MDKKNTSEKENKKDKINLQKCLGSALIFIEALFFWFNVMCNSSYTRNSQKLIKRTVKRDKEELYVRN